MICVLFLNVGHISIKTLTKKMKHKKYTRFSKNQSDPLVDSKN